jgi:predicted dehydrogenase
MDERPITIAILGAGGRGRGFADLLHRRFPHWARVVAVAEPRDDYRSDVAAQWGLPPERVFRDWRDLVARPKLADAALVATLDREHRGPAVAALEQGCHLFLEKPMAVTLRDCEAIDDAARRAGTVTTVCHSLRYHKGKSLFASILRSGRIGRLITIDQIEQVAWWHQAHSFVRGNWRRADTTTFMLLAKSCHDLDFIASLTDEPCRRVSSFGSLTHFRPEHAPKGAAARCVDCPIETDCKYSALRQYVDTNREHWPAAVASHDHDRASHYRAIAEGPYGRCVWRCDNDVVDHQVVAMEFGGGMTATFTMTAFTQHCSRRIRAHGTEGEAYFEDNAVVVRDFGTGNEERIHVAPEAGGHGGGDERVMRTWLRAVRAGDPSLVPTNVAESLRTHRIVFAAEQARLEGRVVELPADGPAIRPEATRRRAAARRRT